MSFTESTSGKCFPSCGSTTSSVGFSSIISSNKQKEKKDLIPEIMRACERALKLLSANADKKGILYYQFHLIFYPN